MVLDVAPFIVRFWYIPGPNHCREAAIRVKADRFAPKVLKLVGEGQSYREISHRLGLSKNTVLDIVKRDRAA
jgi:transposase